MYLSNVYDYVSVEKRHDIISTILTREKRFINCSEVNIKHLDEIDTVIKVIKETYHEKLKIELCIATRELFSYLGDVKEYNGSYVISRFTVPWIKINIGEVYYDFVNNLDIRNFVEKINLEKSYTSWIWNKITAWMYPENYYIL